MSTCDFLLIGCEGCGKTTLLKQLSYMTKNVPLSESALNTLPTNGVELETISHKKHKYVVREIGGNFLPVWPKYYESALMVIFIVDMANYAQLPVTCVEFLNLLSHKGLHKKSILLLLNKIDQPFAMTRAMLEHILALEAAKKEAYTKFGQSIWVEEISAATGLGLDKVLFWMQDTKRSIGHTLSSPKSTPKNSPKGPSSSPKGLLPHPTSFFPSYANNTIYEQMRANQANLYNTTSPPPSLFTPSPAPPTGNINVNINTNNNTSINMNNNNPHLPGSASSTTVAIAKQKDRIPNPLNSSLSVLYNPNPNENVFYTPYPSTSSGSLFGPTNFNSTSTNSNTNNSSNNSTSTINTSSNVNTNINTNTNSNLTTTVSNFNSENTNTSSAIVDTNSNLNTNSTT